MDMDVVIWSKSRETSCTGVMNRLVLCTRQLHSLKHRNVVEVWDVNGRHRRPQGATHEQLGWQQASGQWGGAIGQQGEVEVGSRIGSLAEELFDYVDALLRFAVGLGVQGTGFHMHKVVHPGKVGPFLACEPGAIVRHHSEWDAVSSKGVLTGTDDCR
ncbi:hypothetical protein scyTo_0005139 [Scyliorhinus torazame]|uniref:Uncharacterized protein n=1 Tax=Scyliorhinus torazame TaxID=75743 RepID=A0A401P2X4_SCYTO|nr:hypothetical protein [Scyliorhinus torazame]